MSFRAARVSVQMPSRRVAIDFYLVALAGLKQLALVLAPPILRIALALPFLRSAMTRWDGPLSLAPATTFLFAQMFKLHILGGEYPIPFPEVMAYVVASVEFVLPTLLILGFATRLAALGLLVMTGVIQLVVPDGWANFHLYWAALALAIVALGAGVLSLDHLVLLAYRRATHPPPDPA